MNSSFDRTNQSEEWLTPPQIIRDLGPFDLDPCAPITRPWYMATVHYTKEDDGLALPWGGRVWCNPPYGNKAGLFLKKLKDHGNGVALIFARTETKAWKDHIWGGASGVMFVYGRLKFCRPDGSQGESAGAPSALIAYGEENAQMLQEYASRTGKGKFIRLGE